MVRWCCVIIASLTHFAVLFLNIFSNLANPAAAKGQFTYWSVRAFNRPGNKGIRLDYFICSRDLFPPGEEDSEAKKSNVMAHDSYILHKDTVGCSDHCPVVLVVKIN